MNIVPTKQLDRAIVNQFFNDHWGSPQMVVSTGIYTCSELDGFAAVENGQRIIGLITFVIRGHECEIISLDSIMENRGVGSALLHEAETWARQQGCTTVQLITEKAVFHPTFSIVG
ncbi:hypothetical protein BJQ97_01905 [Geobacillus sp. TFV-3]|nr:hypothetical protein BJQ97_01905 [Geobacillus sp. TFV-3]